MNIVIMERLVKNHLLTIIPISFPRHLFSHPKIFTRFLYPLVHFLPHLYGERARLPSNSKMDIGIPAPQPARLQCGQPGFVLQHGGELSHQHQLAGLRGRGHDELSHADAGACSAELLLRRDTGHGHCGSADPWVCPALDGDDRQLLGGHDPARSTFSCRFR